MQARAPSKTVWTFMDLRHLGLSQHYSLNSQNLLQCTNSTMTGHHLSHQTYHLHYKGRLLQQANLFACIRSELLIEVLADLRNFVLVLPDWCDLDVCSECCWQTRCRVFEDVLGSMTVDPSSKLSQTCVVCQTAPKHDYRIQTKCNKLPTLHIHSLCNDLKFSSVANSWVNSWVACVVAWL